MFEKTKLYEEIIKDCKDFVKSNKGMKIDGNNPRAYTYLSPRVSSEYMDCSMPLTFDSYSHCHPAGTLVETPNGRIPIEDINIGDEVICFSVKDNSTEISEVINNFKREVTSTILIETEDGDMLELTEDHPVFVINQGWIMAKRLTENDVILKIER